ncbi:MAG: hypothetical protein FIA94_01150 [Nitrospirae bacterium]|nr:hypothetical protein [Nitrospirota bacterium]
MTNELFKRGLRQGSLVMRLLLILSGAGGVVTLTFVAFMKLMASFGSQQEAAWTPLFLMGFIVALAAGGISGIIAGKKLHKALIGDHRFPCFACGEKAAIAKLGRSYEGFVGRIRAQAWDFHCERCGRIDRGGEGL